MCPFLKRARSALRLVGDLAELACLASFVAAVAVLAPLLRAAL